MKAIILVGGEGTRLRPLTCQIPKAMVPIVNRPFLEQVVKHLKSHGVDTIILTLCYLPERIQSYFGDGSKFGVKMVYIEEKAPLGTAGAVKNSEMLLMDGPFYVLNGDVYTDLDMTAMLKAHLANKAAATIALTPVEDVTMYGVVETLRGGKVQRFVEKPRPDEVNTNMINAGTYILEPSVLHNIPPGIPFSFERQLFPSLLSQKQRVFGFPSHGYWIDIGKPEKYLELNYRLLTDPDRGGKPAAGEGTPGEIIGKASSVHLSAVIEGPVAIGESCTIEADVMIKGPSAIGNGCCIGRGARLDRVILWDNVRIGANAKLENCVVASNCLVNDNCCVGAGCVVGPGVTVAPDCVVKSGAQVWPGTIVS